MKTQPPVNDAVNVSGHPGKGVTLLATGLGAGFLPLAPGTWGTAVAVPLAWGASKLGQLSFLAATLIVTLAGVWAAERYCRATGREDDQRVVIDEVAGYMVTLLLVPRGAMELILAFILFRILDMWKPPPLRWLDENVKGGLGVMLDDVGAGIYGAILLWLGERMGWIAWLAAKVGL